MGGAIAVRVADAAGDQVNLKGLMVIDVVEGTALASLAHMTTFLYVGLQSRVWSA